jgi:hypothetical protein
VADFYATMLVRTVPEAPWSVLLESDAWQALSCATHRAPMPPAEPPPLSQAVKWIAQLGGFVGRRPSDLPELKSCGRAFSILAASR